MSPQRAAISAKLDRAGICPIGAHRAAVTKGRYARGGMAALGREEGWCRGRRRISANKTLAFFFAPRTRIGFGFPAATLTTVLNHISGSRAGIAGVCQRHDWAAEKRAALDSWATHVLAVAEQRSPTDNVVKLALKTSE